MIPRSASWHMLVISFVIALMLDIFPLSPGLLWWRPMFTLLLLIYWVLMEPYRVSVGAAFFIGLLLDLLDGSLLGEHALAFVVVAYLVTKLYRQLRAFHFPQQCLAVFICLLIVKLVIFILQLIIGESLHTSFYWFSLLSSIIIWPLLWFGFNSLRRVED